MKLFRIEHTRKWKDGFGLRINDYVRAETKGNALDIFFKEREGQIIEDVKVEEELEIF